MLLRNYVRSQGVRGNFTLRVAEPHSLNEVGQFALGDVYVVQLMNGNSITVNELGDMIDIICDELRAAPNFDVEVFAGAGRTNKNTLFIKPKQELGVPFGRNLRTLRQNLMLWMAHYSLAGEFPPDVPRRMAAAATFKRWGT